jgi:uncharacterized protein (DUF2267 family)/CBS domain-containing protein
MHVADIMTPTVRTVEAKAQAAQAAEIMRDERIGALPVTEGDRCCGFLTDRDLVTRAAAEGRALGGTPVKDVMTPITVMVKEGDTVESAGQAMKDHRVRRLVVVDDQDNPIGMLSIDDLAMSPASRPHIEELIRATSPIPEPHGEPQASPPPPATPPHPKEEVPSQREGAKPAPGTHAERVLHPLENSLHHAAGWVRSVEIALGDNDPRRAIRNIRAVLHAVRDNLTLDEASDLAAQMPHLIRGIFYEGWKPSDTTPAKDRTAEQFLDRVRRVLTDRDDPEQAASAVFAAIEQQVTEGEALQAKQMLTKEVQEMWPRAAVAAG